MFAFTFQFGNRLTNCIMLLNEIGGEPQKFEDERLEFTLKTTVLVGKELYAFKYGNPVSVEKYIDFTSNENLVKTTLSNLPRNEHLFDFSLCHVAGNIVLTGGRDKQMVRSAQTYLMVLQTSRW